MRDHLIEQFRPNINAGYTYAELIALRTAGKGIPDHWIVRTKRDEDQDDEAAKLQKAIAKDLAAAEKAREDELKAKDSETIPKLKALESEFDALKVDAAEAKAAAVEAVREYRQAHRAAAGKFGAMRRLVKDTYPEPARDNDGNPVDGSVYADWNGHVVIKGQRIDPLVIEPIFDTPMFRGM